MGYNGDGVWLMAPLMAHHRGLRPEEGFGVLFAVALLKTGPAAGWVLFSGSGFPSVCLVSVSPQVEQSQKVSSSLNKWLVVSQVLRFDPNPTH